MVPIYQEWSTVVGVGQWFQSTNPHGPTVGAERIWIRWEVQGGMGTKWSSLKVAETVTVVELNFS